MRLTKFGHSCIRVEGPGGGLVVDPGGLTEPEALVGASSVLITHEHFDHFTEGRIRTAVAADPGLQVWTVSAVAELLSGLGGQLHVVGHGDTFCAAGLDVEAHGSWHAQVHPDMPGVANTGFLIDQCVFHPGDAFTVPDKPVSILLLPVHAPWLRIADVIDWVREVAPKRAIGVHDGGLNAIGAAVVDGLLGEYGPGIKAAYCRLESWEATDVGSANDSHVTDVSGL